MGSRNIIGHVSMGAAAVLFSLLAPFCKFIYTGSILEGLDLAAFRMLGAGILFWLTSLFLPKEPIERADWPYLLLAGLSGTVFSQGMYTYGIQYTSPTNSSIIGAMVPIFILIFSAVWFSSKITLNKALGMLISFAGIITLVMGGGSHAAGGLKGDMICLVSQIISACYFTFFGRIIVKYSPITFMKWMFLIGGSVMLVVRGAHLMEIDYAQVDRQVLYALGYVVVVATFIAYQLMYMGQKYLRPEVVGLYIYPQPFLAALAAILLGIDQFAWYKLLAAVLIVVGVCIVNRRRPKEMQAAADS